MKKLLLSLLVFTCLVSAAQNIPVPPNPPRLVNDFAHVMTADQIQDLENKLVAYDDSTSIQIAVITIQTTGDYAIDDYALKILRDWKVGNKKTNNGLVVLAAIQDHKVFIATGYGMEGVVPDITAKEIVENEIVPNFRQQNYYRGFDLATDAIIKASRGEYKAPAGYNQRKTPGGGNILGIIIFIVIQSRRTRIKKPYFYLTGLALPSSQWRWPKQQCHNRDQYSPWYHECRDSRYGRYHSSP
jgi:uncharacterized protein